MTIYKRKTPGFVIQEFDMTGNCISQRFLAGVEVVFEKYINNRQEEIDEDELDWLSDKDFPFDMVQPK